MTDIALVNHTGHYQVDRILRGIVGVLELSFPDRIRGYYLTGSYHDGSAVSTSDLDLFVLFKDDLMPEESNRTKALCDECSFLSPIRLDVYPNGEKHLSWFAGVLVKDASLFLYGEDTRLQMVRTPLDQFVQGAAYGCCYLLSTLYQTNTLVYPLGYPDPDDPFYGYYAEELVLPTGETHPIGKQFITNAICSPATGIVALKARQYIATKHACSVAYRAYIGDEFTPLVETAYEQGKLAWHYKIPVAPSDRDQLRGLCAQTPSLANRFLLTLKPYLLAELQHADQERQGAALHILERVIYPADDDVIRALEDMTDLPEMLHQAVTQTLAKIHQVRRDLSQDAPDEPTSLAESGV